MPDQVGAVHFAFVFFDEFFRARERHLIDIFVNLFSGHTDTSVDDAQGLGLFVEFDMNGQIAQFAFGLTKIGQGL